MARRNWVVAFLFGFAFFMTLVAMSFVGFLAPATAFENLVQRISEVAGFMAVLGGVAFVLVSSWSLLLEENRTARKVALRNWVVAFLIGNGCCLALAAMGMSGGYFGPSTIWQHLLRQVAEAIVLILACAGAGYALFDVLMLRRAERGQGRRTALRIGARIALATVLLLLGVGRLLGDWLSGAMVALSIFMILCLSIAIELVVC
jgi:hypothetical protein